MNHYEEIAGYCSAIIDKYGAPTADVRKAMQASLEHAKVLDDMPAEPVSEVAMKMLEEGK